MVGNLFFLCAATNLASLAVVLRASDLLMAAASIH